VDETAVALLTTLEAQRNHVTGILDGLDRNALLTPVLPTGWSCLGLVQHLAVDVERFWFRAVMAGEGAAWAEFGDDQPSAWHVGPDTVAADVFGLYRDEITRANAVIASHQSDTAPAAWPEDMFGSFRLPDLRAVMLHVIAETACHAGHLDAARELIDGRTWMVL
jgi:Protein of unknown function (DUF664)